jgi:hypothetical protein
MNLELPSSLELLEERLREFFQGMLWKLHLNAHKKTPEVTDIPGIIDMLLGEVEEFNEQLQLDIEDANASIELFDTANFAFLAFLAIRNRGSADWRNTPEKDMD